MNALIKYKKPYPCDIFRSKSIGRRMASVKVTFTQIVDPSFPGVGAFEFTDAAGKTIVVHEKLPVAGVNKDEIVAEVYLRCTTRTAMQNNIVIDISRPDAMEDDQGQIHFWVSADLVNE